jgi:hypothetical protein
MTFRATTRAYADHIELHALRCLQRESESSPFLLVSERGVLCTTAPFAGMMGRAGYCNLDFADYLVVASTRASSSFAVEDEMPGKTHFMGLPSSPDKRRQADA